MANTMVDEDRGCKGVYKSEIAPSAGATLGSSESSEGYPRYAPNPVYPKKKKNVAHHPEEKNSANTGDNDGEIRVPEQGFEERDRWSASASEESGKETYLRQLLNARSLNLNRSSKSYIQEHVEESVEDDRSVASLPYAATLRGGALPVLKRLVRILAMTRGH